MNREISDDEAREMLRKLDRKKKAEAVLSRRGPLTELRQSLSFGFLGFSSGMMALYAMKRVEIPDLMKVLIAISFMIAVLTPCALWGLRRRLDAVVELLKAYDAQSSRKDGPPATSPS